MLPSLRNAQKLGRQAMMIIHQGLCKTLSLPVCSEVARVGNTPDDPHIFLFFDEYSKPIGDVA